MFEGHLEAAKIKGSLAEHIGKLMQPIQEYTVLSDEDAIIYSITEEGITTHYHPSLSYEEIALIHHLKSGSFEVIISTLPNQTLLWLQAAGRLYDEFRFWQESKQIRAFH